VARLGKAPLLTAVGGVLLALALFLPWFDHLTGAVFYAPLSDSPDTAVFSGDRNAWGSFRFADVLMAVVAAAAIVATALAHRIPRGWGWLAVTVAGCGTCAGVVYSIFRPNVVGGQPAIGFFVALFGAALIAAGGLLGTAAADRA
jgi:hypothetical protein